MTITTAKQPLRLAPLVAALMVALPAQADWRVKPSLGVTETWTDNVDLQSEPLARSELITQVSPGIAVIGNSRRLQVTAAAQWHQFAFLHGNNRTTADSQRQYSGALHGILANDLLFIDASASRNQRNVSAFGPQGNNDLFRTGNRTEVDTWSISPYLVHRFGSSANLQVRYARDSVDSGTTSAFSDSDSNSISANLTSGAAFTDAGWGLSYYRQDLDSDFQGESRTESVNANLRYRVTPRLFLTANAGYDRYDFGAFGGENKGRNWALGFDWAPSKRTSLIASLGRHYYGQTGTLSASHRSRSTVWSINYGDTITTTRQQFLLPSTIDTVALLDRLFSAAYPDPAVRERVIQAYMEATGLPPSLADNVNYLSNRYMRQKQLQVSSAMRRARSSLVLGLYASERNALSDQRSDSDLLGGSLISLNDNVRQRGATATYSYQINPRSNLVAIWSLSRSRSLTTDIEDRQRALRLSLTRRYSERLLGALELRQRVGERSPGVSGDYREHAIVASLTMQL